MQLQAITIVEQAGNRNPNVGEIFRIRNQVDRWTLSFGDKQFRFRHRILESNMDDGKSIAFPIGTKPADILKIALNATGMKATCIDNRPGIVFAYRLSM